MKKCCFCQVEVDKIFTIQSKYTATGTNHYHCELCYSTSAGNACCYPTQYSDEMTILRTIVQISHIILNKIKEGE